MNQDALGDESQHGREGRYAECESVGDAEGDDHYDLDETKRGIVPGPVILRLFSVVRHFVDSLGVER